MTLKVAQFLAVMLTALALVPAGAHLLALPNKIPLPAESYFAVQGIYRGWAFLGVVLVAALLANLAAALSRYGEGVPFWLAAAAAGLVALNLAVFFAWTYPANAATENWTQIPPHWESLRVQWEYSHAANALLLLAALGLTTASALIERS